MTARSPDEDAIRAAVQRAVDDPDAPPFVAPSEGGKSVLGPTCGGGFLPASAALVALRAPGARVFAFDRPSAPSGWLARALGPRGAGERRDG